MPEGKPPAHGSAAPVQPYGALIDPVNRFWGDLGGAAAKSNHTN